MIIETEGSVFNEFLEQSLYVVYTTTDGDDGWVELYDKKGNALGFCRTFIELVEFGPKDFIRGFTENFGLPDDLESRTDDSIFDWGA